MMTTKYQQVFEEMVAQNKELFVNFKKIHDEFEKNPQSVKNRFNEEGRKIQNVIRKYENRLCGKSEGGKFGKFSSGLSDKFWTLIRNYLPHIDEVGIK